jgi:hypothetical protein
MINLWLSSSTTGIVLIPFLLLYLIAVGIVWLTHLSPARPFFASCIGIVGPFFTSVAVLFALFSAFIANDVQQRNDEVRVAIFHEADGLRTILRLAEAVGGGGRSVTAAVVDYTRSVLTNEWPAMRERLNATEDLGAIRHLTVAMLSPELTATLPADVHQAMLDGLVHVRQARLQRLTLTAGASDPLKWQAMLVLGVLTQIAVAVVQLDRLRPQALALFVFTTAFAATVVLIGLAEQPFAGTEADAAPLRAAVASAPP